jgi:hypothetical protein
MNKTMNRTRHFFSVMAISAIVLLASCGSGKSDCVNTDPTRDPNLPRCDGGTGPTPTPPVSASGTITLTLKNVAGTVTNSVAPDVPGTLEATVKDKSGNPVVGVAVSFATTDKTGGFTPASGTALTNGSGVASISLLAGDSAGAYTSSAITTTTTTPSNAVGYSVVFPTLALSAMTINPTTLSAGGNGSVSITVLNGTAPYTASIPVTFSSACVTQGKATLSSPVVTQNGIATSSYTDKGCGVADTITASVTLAGAITTKTGSINVLPATVGSISFVNADPANLALKGTGGPGRLENSTVTFKVLDSKGNPIVRLVNFSLDTAVGGILVDPASATSAADGTVSTVVKAGTINSPVRVIATVANTSPAITTLSDELVVSSGVVDQAHFSLSTKIFNIEGWNYDGTCTEVTAFLSDHFSNPVPDGTAVSFTAEGGQIRPSCLTGRPNIACGAEPALNPPGSCTVAFKSSNPRPGDNAAFNNSNGRVTIMAYSLGEESFLDNPTIVNGINLFDAGETYQDLREPFRYDRAITDEEANSVNQGNNTIVPGTNEAYIDTDGNGIFSPSDGFYNGVLQSAPNGKVKTIHVRQSLIQIFSGSDAFITSIPGVINFPQCVDGIKFTPGSTSFSFQIFDLNRNIMPAGTTIAIATRNGKINSDTAFKVPNTNSTALDRYSVIVSSDASQNADTLKCSNEVINGDLTITITTPFGVITKYGVNIND